MVKFLQKLAQASFEQVGIGSYPSSAGAMGTAKYLGHNIKHTINDTANKIERRPCTSATRNQKGFYLGLKSYANTVEFEPIHFGLLGNTLGGVATTGSDPYTHVLSEYESPLLPPFNLEHCWDSTVDEARVYNGCVVDNLTLSATQGESLNCAVDYVAAFKYVAGSKESLTEDTTNPYVWHESSILLDAGNSGAYTSASEIDGIKDWSLKISNNLIAEGRCKGGASNVNSIARPQATMREYELQFTWDMDDDAYTDLLDASTDIAYQLYVYRGASDYLKLTIENAQVVTAPDNMDAEGDLVPQTVTIRGGQLDATAGNRTCIDGYASSAEWGADNP